MAEPHPKPDPTTKPTGPLPSPAENIESSTAAHGHVEHARVKSEDDAHVSQEKNHKSTQTKTSHADPASETANNFRGGGVLNFNPTIGQAELGPDRQFPVAERLPVQVFVEETRWQKLNYLGPSLTALVSAILAGVVGFGAYQLNSQQLELQKQQNELNKKQTDLQRQQTTAQIDRDKAELADMRIKFLNDVTATDDEKKKVPAEIALAAHGPEARPVVYLAMGVEQVGIRDSAVNVFSRMFQAALTLGERNTLLEELLGQLKSFNKTLHTGVMEALVEIGPLLNDAERQKVIAFIQQNVPPGPVCADPEGRETIRATAAFFWVNDANSIPYLLDILRNPKCGDGWLQAVEQLEAITEKQPERRAELLKAIKQIKEEVLNTLEQNVKAEDLMSGGYQLFLKKGQVNVKLFKKRVEAEFNRLDQSPGEQ